LRQIRTGAVSWSYEDWRGPFYAARSPAARLLEIYAGVAGFDTVEIAATFFGVPRASTLDAWAAQTPDAFLFSAKVPRAITHERRLIRATEAARDFAALMADRLGTKLGALLVQLPPDFTADERSTLEAFIESLASRPAGGSLPWAVEFRNASWTGTDIADWLDARGVACATTDRLDVGGPSLRYVRLLGIQNSVARFDVRQFDRSDEIAGWAARLDAARRRSTADAKPVLVYVRNFFEGHAPATIRALRDALSLPTGTPPAQQQMSLF
jgi:uncharacterized protein YecE (DUF72 family)